MLDSEFWKAWASPWNDEMICAGMPRSAAALVMASTACPSATPGRRLNVRVTEGNWAWWVTESGPARLESISTKVESGTMPPVSGDFT